MNLLTAPQSLLDQFASLREHAPETVGYFIADSERVVQKLLASGLTVESVLATPEWYARHPDLATGEAVTYVADKEVLSRVVGFNLHQGVMARARRPVQNTLAELAEGPLVIMDGIAKSENVGAIVRNAAAFGIRHLLLGPDTCHPYNRRSVRVSMGNVFSMKVHQAPDLPAALATLKAHGVQIHVFENRPFARPLNEMTFPPRTAFVIGSEGTGVSPAILDSADHFVRIPIDEVVYALNAACASAVAFYEFTRQNGGRGAP
jgi:tRNA G18 (ribose-2'-O)-methylase SpoU